MLDTPIQPPHTVFVSHSHADNDLCDRYVAALRSRGLDVWYDRTNMQDGHSLTDDIEAELRRRTAFVLMATPSSLASPWVRAEVAAFRFLAGQDVTRLLLPVRVADCEMPLLMMGIKWIDALALTFDAAIDALAVALRAHVQPSSPTPHDALIAQVEVLRQRGKYAEALAACERALALDPSSTAAWSSKGAAMTEQGRYDEALVAHEQALTLDPNNIRAWNGKGYAMRRLGRIAESDAAYQRADELLGNGGQG
jgi:tetratricopeptide (TPR) repeat protein